MFRISDFGSRIWNLACFAREFSRKALRLSVAAACLLFAVISNATAQDRLVLISPHWEGIKTEFDRAFTAWYQAKTGRTVALDWRDLGGAGDDLRFILSEFKQTPRSIGIDLFFGGGLDPYQELQQKGLLEPHRPPPDVLEGIPADIAGLPLYDPAGQWYGAALSSFGILKNDRVARAMKLPAVRSWRDLAQPGLKGWVGSGDPRNSGVTHMVFESILQAYGWDEGWRVILGMSANVRQFDRSSSSAAKACALGNVAYSVVVDFYGFTQIAEAGPENMSLIIPSGESILNPDSVAILKGAPNRRVAGQFVDFVLSEEGQSLWLAPLGHPSGPKTFSISRMAIRPALYERFDGITLVKINPFRDLKPLPYNAAIGMLRWSPLNALLGAIAIDSPMEKRGRRSIPITEEGLNQLAKSGWKNPILRNQIQLRWQQTP